jgi:hypothetical protein
MGWGLSWVWPDFPASDFKLILAFEEIGFDQSGNSFANNAGLTRLGLFFGRLNNRFFCNPLL